MAVVVPRSQLGRLTALPGVAKVYPSVRYRPQLDRSVPQIGAPTLWGPGLENAGQGMKIAIIDEGIDQRHPFFSPAGYTMPAGYPKGQTAYTTAKVIVARAFPPARPDLEERVEAVRPRAVVPRHARRGHRRRKRQHARRRHTHLRRRAARVPRQLQGADDSHRRRRGPGRQLAGARGCDRSGRRRRHGRDQHVARRAGDRAIPRHRRAGTRAQRLAPAWSPSSRPATTSATSAAGRSARPARAPDAITVGAVSTSRNGADDVVASFSSSGPTPLSLRLKPEVSAPGVSIFSAAPGDSYATLSGTSMAAPHVAGGVALLLQRHPTWTPAQVKSALALTGDTAWSDDRRVRGADRPCAAAEVSSTCPGPTTRSSSRPGRALLRPGRIRPPPRHSRSSSRTRAAARAVDRLARRPRIGSTVDRRRRSRRR